MAGKILAAILALLISGGAAAAAYPEKNIQGIVMWGAGGALDNVSRAVAPVASAALGKTVIMQNKAGATGAIAAIAVANAPADGYTVLFGAENPNLYKVTGLSQIDYDNFDPIIFCSWRTSGRLSYPRTHLTGPFASLSKPRLGAPP